MKVLICGGIKVGSITKSLRVMFKSGAIEFVDTKSISDLAHLLARGDYYDRVIVMEQGITDDNNIRDEFDIRSKLSDFVYNIMNKTTKEITCVFTVSDKDMARIVAEETIYIATNVKILVKKPKYALAYFKEIVANGLDEIKAVDNSEIYELSGLSSIDADSLVYSSDTERSNIADSSDLDSINDVNFEGIETDNDASKEIDISEEVNNIQDFDAEFDDTISDKNIEFTDMDDDFDYDNRADAEKSQSYISVKHIKTSTDNAKELNTNDLGSLYSDDNDITGVANNIDDYNVDDVEGKKGNVAGNLNINDEKKSSNRVIDSDNIDDSELDLDNTEDSELGLDSIEDSELDLDNIEDSELDLDNTEDDELNLDNIDDSELDLDNIEDSELDLNSVEDSELDLNSIEDSELDLDNIDDSELDLDNIDDSELGELDLDNTEDDEIELDNIEDSELGELDLDSIEDSELDLDNTDDSELDLDSIEDSELDLDSIEDSELDLDNTDDSELDLDSIDGTKNKLDLGSLTEDDDLNDIEINVGNIKSKVTNNLNDVDISTDKEVNVKDDIDMGINTDKNNLDSNNKDGYVNTDGSINELDSLFDIDSKTSDDVSLNDIFDVKNNSKSGLNGTKTNIESINAFDIDKDDDIGVDQSQNNNSNVKKKSKIGGLFGLGKRVKQDESEEDKLKAVLHTYKNRGISIVVTGTSNSGKSTLAYNLANIVANLGYSVLIVDMDTVGRSQAFISKQSYNAVHSLNPENASLKQALNAVNTGVSRYVNIIRPGFHLLTMGLGGDIVEGEKLAPKTKLARFATSVRRNYHCIIYDMPFNVATEYAEDITITSDNIVLSCEASTHGLMNMLLLMCNINSGDVEETMFTRSQICFTKYKGFKSVLGVNVRNELEVLNRLDSEVQGLLGIDPEYYFSNLSICGLMGYDERYDASWFSERAYTDLVDGREEYIKLLSTILLKR